MLFVYLIYSPDNIVKFVILENNIDEFCLCNRFQLLLGTIKLPSVARLINWVIITVIFMHIHFLIELAKFHIVLLIVKFTYVKSQAPIFFSSWKNLDKTLALFSCNINFVSVQERHKVIHKNDILIVWIGKLSYFLDELLPIWFNFLEYFFIYSNAIVLLHFEMKLAKVILPKHSLPALSMFAIFLSVFLMWAHWSLTVSIRSSRRATLKTMVRIVLSEVETLSWVNLTPNRHLKVFIGYLAIFV
jgi:hypothetical protein